jgi:DNA-binding transcriptional ArsR family regulator
MSRIEIFEPALAGLFGSDSAYQVLMFLQNYERGYASEIARTYGTSLSQIQNQLNKFEQLGLMVSRVEGTSPLPTRFEPFSKRYTASCRNKPSINIIDSGVGRGAMANRNQQ